MHLAIDLRIVDREGMESSGLGRYALELTRALSAARPEWRLTLYGNRPELVADVQRARSRRTRWPTHRAPGRVGWLAAGGALELRRRPDVWFGPSFVLPDWWRGPSVVTIHDLLVFALPERYRGRVNAWYAAGAIARASRRADRVLCGSQATKAEIGQVLGLDPGRVAVTPYGVSEAFFSGDPPLAGESCGPYLRDPYLLFVGTFEARKGLETLNEALGGLRRSGRRLGLVLAGKPGWGTEALLSDMARNPAVRIVTEPTDATIAQLYRGALALVHPSRMEGFGLPVAEAMASRCPVIASDLECVREFAQAAPLYFPVGDAAALAKRVGELLDRPDEAERRRQHGAERAAGLRWSETAQRTAAAIEDALASHRARRRRQSRLHRTGPA